MEHDESIREQVVESTLELLNTDSDLAFSLARIAVEAPLGSEKRSRNTRNARKGVEDVSKALPTVQSNPQAYEKLVKKIEELRALVEELERTP